MVLHRPIETTDLTGNVESPPRNLPAKRLSVLTIRQVLPGNDLGLPVIWTSYQFSLPLPSCNVKLSQSKVKT
jgi:hypothetical protein